MHVFTPKAKYEFFIEQIRTNCTFNEPMADNDAPLVTAIPVPEQPMDASEHGQQKKQKLKTKKTKRGTGKVKKGKNNPNNPINFSLLGSNSNGLKAKLDSLKNNINIFSRPSCVILQETKLFKSRNIVLPGYQIFQLNRAGRLGGGLLSAIDEALDPVLVNAGEDDAEILVVQIKVGHLDVRVFNAYGPQEDEKSLSLKFWLCLEKEIMKAKQENCCILIEIILHMLTSSYPPPW